MCEVILEESDPKSQKWRVSRTARISRIYQVSESYTISDFIAAIIQVNFGRYLLSGTSSLIMHDMIYCLKH